MTEPVPEFSRPVPIARLSAQPAHFEIMAETGECAALAKRFDLLAIDRLSADVSLRRLRDGAVRLDASFEADIVQSCIVSLEPVPAHVSEHFAILFRPDISERDADRLAFEDPAGDFVEPLPADSVDIGEAIAQQLSLAMEPYPRAAGLEAD